MMTKDGRNAAPPATAAPFTFPLASTLPADIPAVATPPSSIRMMTKGIPRISPSMRYATSRIPNPAYWRPVGAC